MFKTRTAVLLALGLCVAALCGAAEWVGMLDGSGDRCDTWPNSYFTSAYGAFIDGEPYDVTPSVPDAIPASEVPESYINLAQDCLREMVKPEHLPESFDLSTWSGLTDSNEICGSFTAPGSSAHVEFTASSIILVILVESPTLVSTLPQMVTPSVAANTIKSIIAIPEDKEPLLAVPQVNTRSMPAGGVFAYGKSLCEWDANDVLAHDRDWYSRILFIHQEGKVYYFIPNISWHRGEVSPRDYENLWDF